MPINKNIKLILNYFLGPLVFIFLLWSIYHQILGQLHWQRSLQQITAAISGPRGWKFWIVVLLMPVNWGIEARKWQLAIRPAQRITYFRAFGAVLTGTTMASFTPNRMGEYLGRMLYVEEGKRLQSVGLGMICSMAQLLVTMLTGCLGILALQYHLAHQEIWAAPAMHFWLNVLLAAVGFICLGLATLYFRLSWLVRLVGRMPIFEKYQVNVKVLQHVDTTILLEILFLSFTRYLVFIAQYYLMFSVFGVLLTWSQTFSGISMMFLVIAAVPTFTFLTELGIRWEASIQIIELYSTNAVGIFAASLGIWLVNLILPALIGSLLFLSIKLFKK